MGIKENYDIKAYNRVLKQAIKDTVANTEKVKGMLANAHMRYTPLIPHFNFDNIELLRVDTVEMCINQNSFLNSIWDKLPTEHILTHPNISNVRVLLGKRENGFYVKTHKIYLLDNKRAFSDIIYMLSEYLARIGYEPRKYKSFNKEISRGYVENIKAKFKCPYNHKNGVIKITQLHLFNTVDKAFYDSLKNSSKYQDWLLKQGKKEYYTDGVYSVATQRVARHQKTECIYDISEGQGLLYKREYRLGIDEVRRHFEGLALPKMFDIGEVLKHMKSTTDTINGSVRRGLDMRIKGSLEKEIYRAIDTQGSLTKQQRLEILKLIDDKLKPVYIRLDRLEKHVFSNHKKTQEALF